MLNSSRAVKMTLFVIAIREEKINIFFLLDIKFTSCVFLDPSRTVKINVFF